MGISWLVLLSLIINGGTQPAAPTPAAVVYNQMPEQWRLDGIKLGENAYRVIGAWGIPSKVVTDNLHSECETWNYSNLKKVGICNGAVSFVQVLAKAKKAVVDNQVIKMDKTELRQALGKPDFIADDGWLVLRGEEALKVFVDKQGKLVSLDLFGGPDNV
jgi:hypothetical protein